MLKRLCAETSLSVLVFSGYPWAVFLTERDTQADLDAVPPTEVCLMPDGELVASGVGGIRLPF